MARETKKAAAAPADIAGNEALLALANVECWTEHYCRRTRALAEAVRLLLPPSSDRRWSGERALAPVDVHEFRCRLDAARELAQMVDEISESIEAELAEGVAAARRVLTPTRK